MQRISIARALIRDPKILVLGEQKFFVLYSSMKYLSNKLTYDLINVVIQTRQLRLLIKCQRSTSRMHWQISGRKRR